MLMNAYLIVNCNILGGVLHVNEMNLIIYIYIYEMLVVYTICGVRRKVP